MSELSMRPDAVSSAGTAIASASSQAVEAAAQVYGMACVTLGDAVVDGALGRFQGVFSAATNATGTAGRRLGAVLESAAQSTIGTDASVMGGAPPPRGGVTGGR